MNRDHVRSLQREVAALRAQFTRLREQNAAAQQLHAEQECEIETLRQDVATERARRLKAEGGAVSKTLVDDLKTKLARLGKLEAGLVQQREELKVFLRRREMEVQQYLDRHGEDLVRYRQLAATLHARNCDLDADLAAADEAREELEAKLAAAETNAHATEEACGELRQGLSKSEEALGATTKQLRKATGLLSRLQYSGGAVAPGEVVLPTGAADKVVAYVKAATVAQAEVRKEQALLEERLRVVTQELDECKRDREDVREERRLLRDAVDVAMEASAKSSRDASMARAALASVSKMSKEEMQKLRRTVSRLREITAAEVDMEEDSEE